MRPAIYQILTRKPRGKRVGIRCGTSSGYTDSTGGYWLPDTYFYVTSGTVLTYRPIPDAPIANTPDPEIYRDVRYGDNLGTGGTVAVWGYRVPVLKGRYQARLLYAEIFAQAQPPGRLGNIDINGVRKLTSFNEVAAAGQNTAYQMVFNGITPIDGIIDIGITSLTQNFYITALEIVPQ